MKKLFTVLLVFLTLFTIVGCASKSDIIKDDVQDEQTGIDEYRYNLSTMKYSPIGLEEIKTALTPEADFTGIIFMSRETCPYCQKIIPILAAVSSNENTTIYYADTIAIKNSDEYNPEIKFQEVVDMIPEQLKEAGSVNEEGNPAIYLPLLIFMKYGEVLGVRMGLTKDYDETLGYLTNEQYMQVYNEIKSYVDIMKAR